MMGNNEGINIFAKELLGQLPTGIGIFDLTGDVIEAQYISDGYYQMIGVNPEERMQYLGTNTSAAIHPADQLKLLQEAKAAIRDQRIVECRLRILVNDGKYTWIGLRASHKPLNAATERFYAVYFNISEFIRTEEDNNNLHTILGNIPGGVALFSVSEGMAHLAYVNAGYYALHHGSEAYWTRQSANILDWIYPEDRPQVQKEFQSVSSHLKQEGAITYRVVGEDGQIHWLSMQFHIAYMQEGQQYYYASFRDMDELKQTEQARDENRKLYEAAIEEARLVVWEYDIVNHRMSVADNEFTLRDYEKFNLPQTMDNVPQSLVPFIDDAYVEVFLEMYRKIDAGAPQASCEVWYKTHRGVEPRFMHISYRTAYDSEGNPIKAYGIGQNITAQKVARDEYDRIRTQLTHTEGLVGSFQLNLSQNRFIGGFNIFSELEKSMKTQTADEHFQQTIQWILGDKSREKALKFFTCVNLLERFRQGERQFEVEYPFNAVKGGIKWIKIAFHTLQNPLTQDIECITYARDDTTRKRSEEIIQRMASATSDYIGIIDAFSNRCEMFNNFNDHHLVQLGQALSYDKARDMLATLFGMTPEKRRSFMEETEISLLIKQLEGKDQNKLIVDAVDRDQGKAKLKKQITFSWLNDEKQEILVVQQDVTAAYQKEQEQIAALEAAKQKADAASKAKSEFISQMSHDIRTPLNGIIGMSYLAKDEENPPKTVACLDKIDKSSKFLLGLINDILDMTKAESGKLVLQPMPYPVEEFNEYLEAVIVPLCREKNQKFILKADVTLDVVPVADKLRCNQIFFNLLSNAMKYTPEGGTITYTIRGRKLSPSRVVVEHVIADTGIGMSREFLNRIFEPFAQEGRNDASEQRGTGLGLAIVKKLVDAMGGTITVQSELGKGSTFTVTLEFDSVPLEAVKTAADDDQQPLIAGKLQGKCILLCEDHPLNQEIARELLTNMGMCVTVAEDGQQGVDMFRESAPNFYDAILMDIRMPVMNGYEATEAIRALERADARTVPIVAMTADAFSDDIAKCLATGMNAHLAKPVDPKKMYSTLAQVINIRS